MDEKRWWLAKGVIVEYDGYIDSIERTYGNYIVLIGRIDSIHNTKDIIPRGVPFDCMPEWVKFMSFFQYKNEKHVVIKMEGVRTQFVDFPKCPEEWKGKTFEITDELRELIK